MNLTLTLLSKNTLAPSIEFVRFKPNKKISFKAGQHLNLFIPTSYGAVGRPFSIASAPHHKTIELIVKIIPGGLASFFFQNIKPGDTVKAKGANGSFTIPAFDQPTQFIFFSSGTGLAPIRSMILDILKNKKVISIFLCIAQNDNEESLLKNELIDLARNYNNFFFEYSANSIKTAANIAKKDNNEFYICGGSTFVSEINKTLITSGIKKHKIHFEKY